ncbi:MAG: hypothetical protein ACM3TR_15545 [Caulobacteraceae bacterium]
MVKFTYGKAFHFVGKFNELIEHLSNIENKNITLKEYIEHYKKGLN